MPEDYKNHHFMPGQSVKVDNALGQIVARGATPGRYYVEVKFHASGKTQVFVNEQILRITRH